ncbi:hypothetical protein ACIRPQ_29410 [Streptomyces sp. NPDC101213]|uniref:hypothetical protein n=1 Tax=Streptomyces sp. NPDC101213 TaxID=3366130 RepID=UPI0038115AEE
MDMAQSITKDVERAAARLETARKALTESLAGGEMLRPDLIDRLRGAEARYAMWELIGRVMDREMKEEGMQAGDAAAHALTVGRRKCMEKIMSGPSGSSSHTVRALTEAEQAAVREVYEELGGR